MSEPFPTIDVRFDIPLDEDPEVINRAAHAVLSEVGFVPTMGLAQFFSHYMERLLSESDHAAYSEYHAREWQRYHDEVVAEKARINAGRQPVSPQRTPGVAAIDSMLDEVKLLKTLPLPRLPHRIFGMTNATSRPPHPVRLLPDRFYVKLCIEYTLDLSEFGMDPERRYFSPLQNWSLRRPHTTAAESVEPETAHQLWLVTDVGPYSPASGFERYLQLAIQEVAIRLHRELNSRETVGVTWDDGYDPRYPDSMWKGVPMFRFGPSGDEFLWDYVPKHYPERLPLFEPHADALLEAELTEYERWFKATYCR